MNRFVQLADQVSTWTGKAMAWLIIVLMLVVCAEVFKRYLLNAPTAWIFDATNMPDKSAMHMHNVTFTFRDNDHFTQEWTMYQNGKSTMKVAMEFERVK